MIDVTEYLGLANKLAWNMYLKVKHKYEYEDLYQIACMGLIEARNKFDESKQVKFITYAFTTIRGGLINFVQRDKKYNIRRGVPHNLSILSYEFENDNGCLREKIGNDGFEEDIITKTEINEAINKLSQEEKQVMKMYYVNGLLQSEIAEIMNTSQNQISRIKRRISKKLKSALAETYYEKVSV